MRFFVITLLLLFFINASVISIYRDISPSMDDTLLPGDAFIVLNFWYGLRLPFADGLIFRLKEPTPGEILVFKAPVDETEIHVKRCVAVGGQSVEIKAKQLFVDDKQVPLPPKGKYDDPVIIPASESGSGKRDYRPRMTVPDSTIYVMGDNRDFSFDSRIWGFLPKDNLRGKATVIIWSSNPFESWSHPMKKVRWKRIFTAIR